MKKHVLGKAMGIALAMIMVCAGCGNEAVNSSNEVVTSSNEAANSSNETTTSSNEAANSSNEVATSSNEAANSSNETTNSSNEAESQVDVQTQSTQSKDDTMMFSAEEAIAIAEEGMKAIKEKNAERMVQYTDIEVVYYMQNKNLQGKELVDEVASIMSDSSSNLGIVENYQNWENVEFYDAQLLSADEIKELNAFTMDGDMAMLKDAEGIDYNIENAYKLKVNYDGMEEGMVSYMLIISVNGEWKLDIYIAPMKDMMEAIIQMSDF